jgi:hypothetical protein
MPSGRTGPAKLALGIAILLSSEGARSGASRVSDPAPLASPTPKADLFASSVRPVLVQRCAPCHEPGGKLYDRLPFDQSQVVAAHAAGVLKRLKGSDREAVEKWLASLPQSSP